MRNPYTTRWSDMHSRDNKHERALARMEVQHAESQPTKECGKCGGAAFYRPGVGAYQCNMCGAVQSYKGTWR